MRLGRSLTISLRALLATRLRAALALASIGVGVAAVTVTAALGAGAREQVLQRLDTMGTNLLVVRPEQVRLIAARKTVRGVVTTLRVEDYLAISTLDGVELAAPGVEGSARIKAGPRTTNASVFGTTAPCSVIRHFTVASGRFIDVDDELDARRVAVLGARVATSLFGTADPLGQPVAIRGVLFDVVGVLAPKGVSADGSDQDGQVILPARTVLRRWLNVTSLSEVFVRVRRADEMDAVQGRIVNLLRERHRIGDGTPDVAVQNTSRLLTFQQRAADSLDLLTGGLGMLSLLTGGAGIIALMFLSVRERTTEIGLRMAVGARQVDILAQLLIESTALALAGWLAGLLTGTAIAAGLAAATTWPLALPGAAVVASFVLALATGVVFGSLPARRASRLSPIEALASQ